MNVAIIGCGYVADFYMASLKYYPELKICGVYDKNTERLDVFSRHYGIQKYNSLKNLVTDHNVAVVLNLTNPRSHYDINKCCLTAGKHVYSEKPLAMTFNDAKELVTLASSKSLYISVAPCSVLSETAQTIWKALRENRVGDVRLVYANFDAGMTHLHDLRRWRSASGALWPAKDEFEVGCTYEHAGYFLTWLGAFFGPARSITAFASCQIPDKGIPVDINTPDFSVGCIEYRNGIVARVTASILAPTDKSLTIVGDKGVIYVRDIRDDASPVYIRELPPSRLEAAFEYRFEYWANKLERIANWIPWSWGRHWRLTRKYPFAQKPIVRHSANYKPVDFCRGIAEMHLAISRKRPCRLSANFGLHITEMIEVLQYPDRFGGKKVMESYFDPIQPLSC